MDQQSISLEHGAASAEEAASSGIIDCGEKTCNLISNHVEGGGSEKTKQTNLGLGVGRIGQDVRSGWLPCRLAEGSSCRQRRE